MFYLPNETLFNISILIFLVVIVFALGGLLLMIYRFLSRWVSFLQRSDISGADEIKSNATVEAQKMLDEARHRSLEIITEATHKAQETVGSMEKLSLEAKEKLSSELEVASKSLLEFYKTALSEQKAESLHNLEEASQDIEEGLMSEVEDFKDILHKETVETQAEVNKKIQEKYASVEKEISAYRAKQLKVVDETIYDILQDVSKKVFGEALSMEEHQHLVLKALIEAKENNVL